MKCLISSYWGFLETYRYLWEISVVSIPLNTDHVTSQLNILVPKTNVVLFVNVLFHSAQRKYHTIKFETLFFFFFRLMFTDHKNCFYLGNSRKRIPVKMYNRICMIERSVMCARKQRYRQSSSVPPGTKWPVVAKSIWIFTDSCWSCFLFLQGFFICTFPPLISVQFG